MKKKILFLSIITLCIITIVFLSFKINRYQKIVNENILTHMNNINSGITYSIDSLDELLTSKDNQKDNLFDLINNYNDFMQGYKQLTYISNTINNTNYEINIVFQNYSETLKDIELNYCYQNSNDRITIDKVNLEKLSNFLSLLKNTEQSIHDNLLLRNTEKHYFNKYNEIMFKLSNIKDID